jgi:dephospho-CoA kinase
MIVGVTGGIGSGKSLVCEIIQTMGYPVFNADIQAKTIYLNQDFINELALRWNGVVVEGVVDLKKISNIVFNQPNELKWLNSKIHPYVDYLFQQWKQKQKGEIFFKEAAILIESGAYKKCDKIIVVEAPLDVRIQRTIARDKTNSEAILNRIKNQITDEQRREYADFVIVNHQKLIVPQILKIIQSF